MAEDIPPQIEDLLAPTGPEFVVAHCAEKWSRAQGWGSAPSDSRHRPSHVEHLQFPGQPLSAERPGPIPPDMATCPLVQIEERARHSISRTEGPDRGAAIKGREAESDHSGRSARSALRRLLLRRWQTTPEVQGLSPRQVAVTGGVPPSTTTKGGSGGLTTFAGGPLVGPFDQLHDG